MPPDAQPPLMPPCGHWQDGNDCCDRVRDLEAEVARLRDILSVMVGHVTDAELVAVWDRRAVMHTVERARAALAEKAPAVCGYEWPHAYPCDLPAGHLPAPQAWRCSECGDLLTIVKKRLPKVCERCHSRTPFVPATSPAPIRVTPKSKGARP